MGDGTNSIGPSRKSVLTITRVVTPSAGCTILSSSFSAQ